MTRPGWLLSCMALLSMQWEECCQNPAVFCYRIGLSLMARQRSSAARPEHEEPCSSRSENSFASSMMSKG